ncbi:unnamed protein product [Prunus armeniaca]
MDNHRSEENLSNEVNCISIIFRRRPTCEPRRRPWFSSSSKATAMTTCSSSSLCNIFLSSALRLLSFVSLSCLSKHLLKSSI